MVNLHDYSGQYVGMQVHIYKTLYDNEVHVLLEKLVHLYLKINMGHLCY